MEKRRIHITTIDNPFDPFEDFDNWFLFDCEKGYYTCSRLARIANVEENMTEEQEDQEIERATDRLIQLDPLDIYKKLIRIDK